MTDNTPGVEEFWAKVMEWFIDEDALADKKLEEYFCALVESRDALLLKCDALEGHYQELDYMLDDVKAERDQAVKFWKEIIADFQTDAECLPMCDSFGHEEFCPAVNAWEAFKKLKKEHAAAIATLATKCGCIHANVSDGPHPELAAKDRMYATEVCWYHRFVHEENRALTAQNAALRDALKLVGPEILAAIDRRMEEK